MLGFGLLWFGLGIVQSIQGFAEHAKVGVPVTLLSVAFAVIWLAYMDWLPWLPESW